MDSGFASSGGFIAPERQRRRVHRAVAQRMRVAMVADRCNPPPPNFPESHGNYREILPYSSRLFRLAPRATTRSSTWSHGLEPREPGQAGNLFTHGHGHGLAHGHWPTPTAQRYSIHSCHKMIHRGARTSAPSKATRLFESLASWELLSIARFSVKTKASIELPGKEI